MLTGFVAEACSGARVESAGFRGRFLETSLIALMSAGVLVLGATDAHAACNRTDSGSEQRLIATGTSKCVSGDTDFSSKNQSALRAASSRTDDASGDGVAPEVSFTANKVTVTSSGNVSNSVRAEDGVMIFDGSLAITHDQENNGAASATKAGLIVRLGDSLVRIDRNLSIFGSVSRLDAIRVAAGGELYVEGLTEVDVTDHGIQSSEVMERFTSDPHGTSLVSLNDLKLKSENDGLYAKGVLGNGIIVSGKVVEITTTANGAQAIYAESGGKIFIEEDPREITADGDAIVVLDAVDAVVRTNGNNAHGLLARSNEGDARVELGGGSVTTGANGPANSAEGVFALVNGGTGNATIIMSGGEVTANGRDSDGLVAQTDRGNRTGDVYVEMTGGKVTATADDSAGIVAQTETLSSGSTSVLQDGGEIVTEGGGDGLFQGSYGILAIGTGGGSVRVEQASGKVSTSGDDAHGVFVVASTGETTFAQGEEGQITASGEDAHGAYLFSRSRLAATVAGTIEGGSGDAAGINILTPNSTLDIAETGVIGAASGVAINEDNGFGKTVITSAGRINGDILTGTGDDSVTLNAGSFAGRLKTGTGSDTTTILGDVDLSGATLFDGGDDTGIEDGFQDHLVFNGGQRSFSGGELRNWERVSLRNGADLTLSGTLQTGAGVGLVQDALGLLVNSGSRLRNGGREVTVSGDLTNRGRITMQDGFSGDRLTVTGDYDSNGGVLTTDVILGDDSSPSDVLVVEGNTSGATNVFITDNGGDGALTNAGIPVVLVGRVSAGEFTLSNGDYVNDSGDQALIAGAFSYTLQESGDGWYLKSTAIPEEPDEVDPENPDSGAPEGPDGGTTGGPGENPVNPPVSPGAPQEPTNPTTPTTPTNPTEPTPPAGPVYQPGAAAYEAYPAALQALNHLPTLYQRVGDRFQPGLVSDGASGFVVKPREMAWIRVEGEYNDVNTKSSTTSADYDIHSWRMQLGADFYARELDGGVLIMGVNGFVGQAYLDVSSEFGDGKVDTDGFGFGATATWYGDTGFYADLQGQIAFYESDIKSDRLGRLKSNNHGQGYAASIEVGQRVEMDEVWSLTPQAQLDYSLVRFNNFTGKFGESVSESGTDSLNLRIGLSADRDQSWTDENGLVSQGHVYAVGNVHTELLGAQGVKVSGTKLKSKQERVRAELGVGGNYSWNDDKYALYGEVSGSTTVKNTFDSYALEGTLGFRMKF